MPRSAIALLLLLSAIAPAQSTAPTSSAAGGLAGEVQRLITKAATGSKMKVGVSIVELPSGAVLFDDRAEEPMVPASNLKLVSTIIAMHLLGPDFQYETQLTQHGDDLCVFGSGDPSLGDPALAAAKGVDITWMFDRWADELKKRGIKSVGRIVIDDSLFEAPGPNPSWPADQRLRWYEAPVGALNFNDNCLDVWTRKTADGPAALFKPLNARVIVQNHLKAGDKDVLALNRKAGEDVVVASGTVKAGISNPENVTVNDPGLFFGEAFKSHLIASGIAVGGAVVREAIRDDKLAIPPEYTPVALFRTPLLDCVRRANQQSQNLFAECIFKSISAYAPDGRPRWSARAGQAETQAAAVAPAGIGSWQASAKVAGQFLAGLGVPAEEFTLDDGCGLSKANRVSPRTFTRLLAAAWQSPFRDDFVDSLASAGQPDSTLRNRMKNADLRGAVFAKTGYVAGVSCLSGYVKTKSGKAAAFSVLCNNAADVSKAKALQDEIAARIFESLNGAE